MSQRYPPPHQRYTPRQSQYPPGRYEHDRWNRDDRRASPRSFSPGRDRRDSRDYGPRELDIDRAQRLPRDGGPASASSSLSETNRFSNTPFRGSSYSGRGRGRDWPDRGRQRTFGPEDRDRDIFRPRSRSRPRTERERSVDSRDFDRRDDRRDDYRREDDWHYRRSRPDEREFGRRDGVTRSEPKHSDSKPNEDARASSPLDRPRLSSPHKRSSPDLKKDLDLPRRVSTLGDLFTPGSIKREPDRAELSIIRSPNLRDRSVARASEPEGHSSVAVPQFGSIPITANMITAKLANADLNPNSRANTLNAQVPLDRDAQPLPFTREERARTATAPSQLPTQTMFAPTEDEAPPADEQNSGPPATESVSPSEHKTAAAVTSKSQSPQLPASSATKDHDALKAENSTDTGVRDLEDLNSFAREALQQESKVETRNNEHKVDQLSSTKQRAFPRNAPLESPVMSNRLAPPTAPTGPRNSTSQQTPRAVSAGPMSRDISPTATSKTSSLTPKASPVLMNGLPINVPTGPRADRVSRPPPTAPRVQQAFQGRASATSLQWRANAPIVPSRPAIIPAKRDADGEEKESGSAAGADHSLSLTSAHADAPVSVKTSIPYIGSVKAPVDKDVKMSEATGFNSPEALAFDTDDDDMALDEDDFHEQAARYKHKKADLEAQYADLAEQWQRIAALIDESDRLRGILSIINDLPLQDYSSIRPQLSKPVDVVTPVDTSNAGTPVVKPVEPSAPKSDPNESLRGSPDLEFLPYLSRRPLTPALTRENVDDSNANTMVLLLQQLNDSAEVESNHQRKLIAEFSERYRPWKRNVDFMQKVKDEADAEAAALVAEQNKMEVDVAEPMVEIAQAPLLTPNAERRRQFTSVLDLQRVLEESRQEEEARREKAEREAKEARASAEREAIIAPLLNPDELRLRIFTDTSLLRTAEESLRVFEYAPPVDTFTEDEDRRLRDEYDLGTKMWHKIADAVGRTTKECINHYYATKWEQPYKRQKHKKRKGKKGPTRRIDSDMTANDATMGLTETGRPRRAAAPTFSKGDKTKSDDADTDTGLGKKAPSTKTADINLADEKTARGRKPAKEKQARKARAPQPTTKTGPSPQKVVKDKTTKDKIIATVADGVNGNGATVLLPQQPLYGQDSVNSNIAVPSQVPAAQPQIPIMHNAVDVAPQPPVPLSSTAMTSAVIERPRSHSQTQRSGPSSYWSVPEEAEFKECLKHFGTDFNAIANHMGKKTAVMCKNHFSKYKQDPVKYSELLATTRDADERRKSGISLAPLPLSLRKRQDASSATATRVYATAPETLEPINASAVQASEAIHFQPHTRTHLHQPQIAAAPPAYGNHGHSADKTQPKPRMYYQETLASTSHPSHAPPIISPATSTESNRHKQVGRIQTEYEPQVRAIHAGAREHDRRTSMLSNIITPSAARDSVADDHINAQRRHETERYSIPSSSHPLGAQPNLGPNIRPSPYETVTQHNRTAPQRHPEIAAAPMAPAAQQHMHVDQINRPFIPPSPSRDYSATPGFAQRGSVLLTNQQPPTKPIEISAATPSAPSRKVNIMSMLNPEPADETRPRKSETERSRPASGQTLQASIGEPYQHQQPDQYASSATRRMHGSAYPGPQHALAHDSNTSLAPRESWSARSSFAQPASHSNSPHLQHVTAHGPAPSRDFRGPIGSISHSRVAPSSPTGHFGHGRNSSFNSPQAGSMVNAPNTTLSETYSSSNRSNYGLSHLQGGPPTAQGPPLHPAHNYNSGYIEQTGPPPVGQSEARDIRAHETLMRPSSGLRRDFDMSAHRDPRDLRELRERRDLTAQAQHNYSHDHHVKHSPLPPGEGRYAPPPIPQSRMTHSASTQAYAGAHRPADGRSREYDASQPMSHEMREREWAYNEELRRMHGRRQ